MNDASVFETLSLDDHYSRIPLYRRIEIIHENDMSAYSAALYRKDYLDFNNCFKLDVDARELILRSYIKPTRLPGGEVPRYFTHRALGNSLTVTLPQSSLSQDFLLFKACVVVEPGNRWPDFISCLEVRWHFRGVKGIIYMNPDLKLGKTDHLVLVSFKFRAISAPSNLDYNDVEFEFKYKVMIKECGVRLLNVSPSPDGSDGCSERGYNQQCGEKCDVVETGRSKKLMRMTLGTSEESFTLPCGQILADTELTAPNLELPLEQGEASARGSPRSKIPSSSISSNNFHGDGASYYYLPFSGDRASSYVAFSPSYPCLKGEALCVDPMITEQQDTETGIVDLHSLYDLSVLEGDG